MSVARMPRVDTFARLFLGLVLIFFVAAAAGAQSCETRPAPEIDAPAEVCELALVNASIAPPATGSWSSASWSISGGSYIIGGDRLATTTGTSVTFEPDGSGPVTITVNAVDNDGCARPPATRSFALRTITSPVINVAAEVCVNVLEPASVAPPSGGGTWAAMHWTIVNGAFVYGNGYHTSTWEGENASFVAFGNGPVELTVNGTDDQGCSSSNVQTVGIREIEAPSITAPAQICAGGIAPASVTSPAEGAWAQIYWSISGGTFFDYSTYHESPNATGPSVHFRAGGTGEPVMLSAYAINEDGCWSPVGERQVDIRAVAAPVIEAPAEACQYTEQTASVQPPPEGTWANMYWSIVNGFFRDSMGNQTTYASGFSVTFYADGTGPVTLSAGGSDGQGCYSPMGTKTVAVRTIAAPVIDAPAEACQYTGQTASVQPPPEGTWINMYWSIQNGFFRDSMGNQVTYTSGFSVTFYGDGNGPVLLSAGGSDDQGCYSPMGTKTVNVRTIAAPVIDAPAEACQYTGQTASVQPPPEGTWINMYWSIQNGFFRDFMGNQVSYTSGFSVTFYADGNGPVLLSAGGSDDQGCYSPMGTKTVNVRTIPAPVIEAPAQACPNVGQYASVQPPAEGTWTNMYWSIQNGYFRDFMGNQTTYTSGFSVMFYADGNGPVILSAGGSDDQGCYSPMGTQTVAVRTIAAPVIDAPAQACPNIGQYAEVQPPAEGTWTNMYWSIQNGYFRDSMGNQSTSTYGFSVMFYANGDGPVTLSAGGSDDQGCYSPIGTATVAVRTVPPPVINAPANICFGEPGSASVAPPSDGSWSSVYWTIVNGELVGPMGIGSNSASGESVQFRASGTGPVTLQATATDASGCNTSPASIEVALRVVDPPVVNAPSSVCPGQNATASITPAAGDDPFTYISWSITNGTFILTNGQHTDPSGMLVTFQADGTGPVTLEASGNTNAGCWTATTTTTVGIRTIPAPAINAPSVICSLDQQTATVVPPPYNGTWAQTSWTINGGTFAGGGTTGSGTSVAFNADGSGAVTLTFSGTDSAGCVAPPSSIVMPFENVAAPTLTAPANACATGPFTVTVNGSGFSGYSWSVVNGTTGVNNTTSGEVQPNGNGPVTVTVQAFTAAGCMREVSVTVPLVAAPDTTITAPEAMCAGSAVMASVPDGGADANYVWTIQGGQTKAGWPAFEREIVFEPFAGSTSVTLTARVYRPNGCWAESTKVVTVNPMPVAAVEPHPSRICENDTLTLTASEDRVGATYDWNVVGAPVVSGQGTRTIVIQTQYDSYRVDYTLDVSLSGCSSSSSGSVDVSNLDPAITVTGATRFCQGSSVTLTAPAGYQYLWSNQSQAQSIVVTESGSYTVRITDQYGCSQESAPVVVTVDPTPAVDIEVRQSYSDTGSGAIVQQDGDTYEICGNPTIALIPTVLNPANTYSWSNNGSPVNNVTTSGTYTLTMTDANGCSTTSSVTLIFTDYPAKPTISASSTQLCPAGGSVTLTAPAADGWSWSNGASTQSIVVTDPGSYSVSVRNRLCESVPSDPLVVTMGVSTISVSGSTQLCDTSTVTLTANAGDAWQWSNGATTQSITVGAADSYSVITSNNGCAMLASEPVVVTDREVTVNASGPTTFCEGSHVILTASAPGATSIEWNNGAQGATLTVLDSGIYYAIARFSDGCTIGSTAVTVEVREVTATATADRTSVCPGGSINLSGSASGGEGYNYQWFDDTYTAIPGATTPQLTHTPSSSGFVYLKVVDALGCETDSNAIIYTVENALNATITAADAICEGATGSAIVADAGSRATYAWSITGGTIDGPSNTRNILFTPSGLGVVTLDVTVTNPGCSASSSKTVGINALPPATITASGSTTFCEGGSVTLSAPQGAGYSYLWNNDATSPSIDVTESGSFRVIVTDANGCSTTSEYTTTTKNPLPAVPGVSGAASICPNSSIVLTAQGGFSSYVWNTGHVGPTLTVNGPGAYYVTVSNANNCTRRSADHVVSANPATVISAHPANVTMPRNTPRQLSVTATGTPTLQYQWYSGTTGITTAPIAGATSSTLTVQHSKKGTYRYWVRVRSSTCATSVVDSNTATVTVN